MFIIQVKNLTLQQREQWKISSETMEMIDHKIFVIRKYVRLNQYLNTGYVFAPLVSWT